MVVLAKAVLATRTHCQSSQKLTVQLLLNLHVLGLQHADAFLLIPLIELLVHGLFFDDFSTHVEPFAGAFVVEL